MVQVTEHAEAHELLETLRQRMMGDWLKWHREHPGVSLESDEAGDAITGMAEVIAFEVDERSLIVLAPLLWEKESEDLTRDPTIRGAIRNALLSAICVPVWHLGETSAEAADDDYTHPDFFRDPDGTIDGKSLLLHLQGATMKTFRGWAATQPFENLNVNSGNDPDVLWKEGWPLVARTHFEDLDTEHLRALATVDELWDYMPEVQEVLQGCMTMEDAVDSLVREMMRDRIYAWLKEATLLTA